MFSHVFGLFKLNLVATFPKNFFKLLSNIFSFNKELILVTLVNLGSILGNNDANLPIGMIANRFKSKLPIDTFPFSSIPNANSNNILMFSPPQLWSRLL